jgi:uncharacterized protein YqeY
MLRDQVKTEMKNAMKTGEKEKLTTLRMILAAIKDKDIEVRMDHSEDSEAQDTHILKLLQTMVKQRRQSIELYEKGGRQDLVDKERAELDVIQLFLPKPLTEEEQKAAIQSCIDQVGATTIKDMGAVITCLRSRFDGKMDFGQASGKIKLLLS